MVSEGQAILDFTAARDDGDGDGANMQSSTQTVRNIDPRSWGLDPLKTCKRGQSMF